jgi:hypothetical protein
VLRFVPEYEPSDRYFESSRLKLHYVVRGDESKPAQILQHGGRDHARSWDFVAQESDRAAHLRDEESGIRV